MQSRFKLLAIIPLLLAVISFSTKDAVAQAGRLDPAFGNSGTIVTEFGNLSPGSPVNGVPYAAVEQPDGKILVVNTKKRDQLVTYGNCRSFSFGDVLNPADGKKIAHWLLTKPSGPGTRLLS